MVPVKKGLAVKSGIQYFSKRSKGQYLLFGPVFYDYFGISLFGGGQKHFISFSTACSNDHQGSIGWNFT